MGRIFYIMGKSSSGKDTIYKELSRSTRLGLKTNIPYTTRPIREGEKNGVEYFFVDERELERIREAGNLIEEREYHTCHGIWKYFTVNDDQIDLGRNDYLDRNTGILSCRSKILWGRGSNPHFDPIG